MESRGSIGRSRRIARGFGGTLASAAALLCLTEVGHADVVFSTANDFVSGSTEVIVGTPPGTGAGTLTVDGTSSPTALSLSGSGGSSAYVDVGGEVSASTGGNGTVTVENGGGIAIDSDLGTGAAGLQAGINGGTGVVTVTGTGSTIAVTGTNANLGGDGYTIGRSGSGTLNVLSGGSVVEDNTGTVAEGGMAIGGNASQVANGATPGTGSVLVSGAGSTIALESAHADLYVGYSGTGTLAIQQGGSVTTTNAYVGALGGSTGTVTIDNGTLSLAGATPLVEIGGGGGGTFTVQNGGQATGAATAYVGLNGSTGVLTVNGANSSFTMAGSGTTSAFLGVGVNAAAAASANSTVLVENGGAIKIDSDQGTSGAGLDAGLNGASGTVTVTGAGSTISVTGTDGNLGGDGYGIGQSGSGTLNVLNGGSVVEDNTGTAAQGGMSIGGSSFQVAKGETPGTGAVTVSGAGSTIALESTNGSLVVGYTGMGSLAVNQLGSVTSAKILVGNLGTGTGNLTVNQLGSMASETMIVGNDAGSNGTVTLDGTGSSIVLAGQDSAGGARLIVGAGGAGAMTVSNGAQLTIDPTNTTGAAGISVGGSMTEAGGTGVFKVTEGSTVSIDSSTGSAALVVGRNGTGTMAIAGGSTVGVTYGAGTAGGVFVGALASSSGTPATAPLVGTLTIAGGSTLNTGGVLGIASDGNPADDSNPGLTGTGTVILTGNSIVNSANVYIGKNGIFGGNGTVNGNVTNWGGVLQVGASPDPLTITGSYTQTGGTIDLEVDSNGTGGYLTDSLIFDPDAVIDITGADFVFNFEDGVDPSAFFQSFGPGADGADVLADFFETTDAGTPLTTAQLEGIYGDDDVFTATSPDYTIDSLTFTPDGQPSIEETANVPEPGTLALFGSGLLVMFGMRRRHRRG